MGRGARERTYTLALGIALSSLDSGQEAWRTRAAAALWAVVRPRVRRPHNRRGRFADAIVRSIDASQTQRALACVWRSWSRLQAARDGFLGRARRQVRCPPWHAVRAERGASGGSG